MENENQNNNAQEIKREAQETVNQVKDSFKNVDVKEETEKAKNFFTGIFKTPAKMMKTIANDSSNTFFKTALVLVIVWVLLSGFNEVIGFVRKIVKLGFSYIKFADFASIITGTLTPLIIVFALTGITYFLHSKSNKKSFLMVLNTIVASLLPFVIIKLINIITNFVSIITTGFARITTPFITILQLVSVVLMYFGIKGLAGENDDNATKKFVIIQAIYCVVAFVLGFLTFGLYLV